MNCYEGVLDKFVDQWIIPISLIGIMIIFFTIFPWAFYQVIKAGR